MFIMCPCSPRIPLMSESCTVQVQICEVPFALSRLLSHTHTHSQRKSKTGCLTVDCESAYWLCKKEKKKTWREEVGFSLEKRGRYTQRRESRWVLSGLDFSIWGPCPWQQTAGRACTRVSPAFHCKHVLWGRRRRGAHPGVWGSWWHGGASMRHFSVFLF